MSTGNLIEWPWLIQSTAGEVIAVVISSANDHDTARREADVLFKKWCTGQGRNVEKEGLVLKEVLEHIVR